MVSAAQAQQPITLADVPEGLPVIQADEPLAKGYSAAKAAEYLDRSALNWMKTKKVRHLPFHSVLYGRATGSGRGFARFGRDAPLL